MIFSKLTLIIVVRVAHGRSVAHYTDDHVHRVANVVVNGNGLLDLGVDVLVDDKFNFVGDAATAGDKTGCSNVIVVVLVLGQLLDLDIGRVHKVENGGAIAPGMLKHDARFATVAHDDREGLVGPAILRRTCNSDLIYLIIYLV